MYPLLLNQKKEVAQPLAHLYLVPLLPLSFGLAQQQPLHLFLLREVSASHLIFPFYVQESGYFLLQFQA